MQPPGSGCATHGQAHQQSFQGAVEKTGTGAVGEPPGFRIGQAMPWQVRGLAHRDGQSSMTRAVPGFTEAHGDGWS